MATEFEEHNLPGGWWTDVRASGGLIGRIRLHGARQFAFYRGESQLNPSRVPSDLEALRYNIATNLLDYGS